MRITIILALLLGGLSLEGAVLVGPVFNPANGHFYSLLTSNTWTGAQAEATGRLGPNFPSLLAVQWG